MFRLEGGFNSVHYLIETEITMNGKEGRREERKGKEGRGGRRGERKREKERTVNIKIQIGQKFLLHDFEECGQD